MKPYIDKWKIYTAINRLGVQITQDYKQKSPITIIGIMDGSLLFMADLIRQINLDFKIATIKISSYVGRYQQNPIIKYCDLSDIKDNHVIVIDDIYDTGQTLKLIQDEVLSYKPLSLEFCVLLNKNIDKKEKINVKYRGLNIENEFVVGFGMDCNGLYRHLSYIGILE